jgi:putative spermidine/putrescine transport system permease protein
MSYVSGAPAAARAGAAAPRRRRPTLVGSAALGDALLLAPLVVFLTAMVLVPLVMAALASVGLTDVVPGLPGYFTLDGYREFFDPAKPSLHALWFTIKVTAITTVLSTAIGGALAIFMHCRRIAVTGAVAFLVKIPLFAPHLVTAFIFWVLLYPKGYLGIIAQKLLVDYLGLMEKAPALVNDPYGIAIILCGTWMRFPYAFLILYGLLQMLDPSYEEAARTLGARTRDVVRRVYLPLTRFGVLSAVLLNFLALFIAFSIPYVLGASWPQFLSVFIYVNAKDQGNWLSGYSTAMVYIAFALVISFFYTRLQSRTKNDA